MGNWEMYTPDGWLNFPEIDAVAKRYRVNFIIIIGKRQVGKTFGCLKLMLDDDRRFVFARKTSTEIDMLNRGVNSPFEKVSNGAVKFKPEGKYTSQIIKTETLTEGDKETQIGLGVALSTIGKIRGFNGDIYTDFVIDEFITESHMFKIRHEGDAFLNAHTTINGNREMEGRPCLLTWLLANSNDLNSDILAALNVIEVIERMITRGEEWKILNDRGVMILLPDSTKVVSERKKGGLYRAIGGSSSFSKMAYENEFSYNDFSNVRTMPVREYYPYINVADLTLHLHKSNKTLYVTDRFNVKCRYEYADTEADLRRFTHEQADLNYMYRSNRIVFNSQSIKIKFKNYLKLS